MLITFLFEKTKKYHFDVESYKIDIPRVFILIDDIPLLQ